MPSSTYHAIPRECASPPASPPRVVKYAASVCLFGFVTLLTALSQSHAADDDNTITVVAWVFADRSACLELYGRGDTPSGSRFGRSLAEALDVANADYEVEDLGEGAWRLQAWNESFLDRDGMMRSGELDIDSLRPALLRLGYENAFVTVCVPSTPYTEVRPSMDLEGQDNETLYFNRRWEFAERWNSVSIQFGYSTLTGASQAGLPAVLSIMTVLGGVVLTRRAKKRSLVDVGGACFGLNKSYTFVLMLHWLLWIAISTGLDPVLPAGYLFGWTYEQSSNVNRFAIPILGAIGPILCRQTMYTVFTSFPGATFSRAAYFRHSLYSNLMIVSIAMIVPSVGYAFDMYSPFLAIAYIAAGLAGAYVFRILSFYAIGALPQAINEGELRNRVDALAEAAGVPNIRNLHVMYMTQFPQSNAFAVSGMRIMLTDYLLKLLTKREVDAIVAHELGHLKHGHPKKIALLLLVMAPVAGVFAACGTFAMDFALPDDAPLAGLAGLAGLVVTITIVTFSMTAFMMSTLRRFEYMADAEGHRLTGDAEAAISSLARITRFNRMPLEWSRIGGLFLTHPSTKTRSQVIANAVGIAPARMELLLNGESVGEDHYEVPSSSRHDRAFSTVHKTRVVLRILLGFVALTSIVPFLAAEASLHVFDEGIAPLICAVAGVLATWIALWGFQVFTSLQGFQTLARQLAPRNILDDESIDDYTFVTLCPTGDICLYEGFTSWDVGFLRTTDAGLVYRGDAAAFSIPKQAISTIAVSAMPSGWLADKRIQIDWTDEGGVERRYLFACANALTLLGANRLSQSFAATLRRWRTTEADELDGPLPLPLPTCSDVKGPPISDFITVRRALAQCVALGLVAALFATVAGLDALAPWSGSACYAGLAGLLSAILFFLPGTVKLRRELARRR